MSLLLANQLLVVLNTDSIAAVSRTRGLRRRIIDQKHVMFSQPIEALKSELPNWLQATKQLGSLLAAMQIQPKTELKITLASDFVRYMALPSQPIHMSTVEKLAYAAAAYREIYGEVVEGWDIKLNDSPDHQTTIAAAIDKKLLDVFTQVSLKYQLKLSSVQPYLMSAYNCLSSQISKTSDYLAIVEFKRLLLINLDRGNCQNLRTYALGSDWQLELKSLLMRELLVSDNSNQEILVYAPVQKNIALNAIENWKIRRIKTLKSVLSNYHFAMLEVAL